MAFSRSSSATYFDSSGVLQTAGVDTLRNGAYDPVDLVLIGNLIETARTNSVRNPRAEGAATGTPGTFPTNWSGLNVSGLSRQIAGFGSEDGIPYCDIRLFGTSNAGLLQIIVEPTGSGIPCLSGQQWTSSVYLRLVGGSYTNFSTTSGTCLELVFYSSVGGALVTGGSTSDPAPLPTSAPLRTQRYAVSFNPTNASIAQNTGCNIRFNITSGTAIDFTIRIGAPQTELITSSPTNFMGLISNGCTQTAISQTNFQLDPLGTSRAIFLTDTSVVGTHFINQVSGTVANNQQLTYSLYAKDAGRRYMRLQVFDSLSTGNQMNAYFDIPNGVLASAATANGLATNVSAGIVAVGGGWYRLWVTGVLSPTADTTVTARLLLYNAPSGNGSYGDGTGLGHFLWGHQLEVGSSPTALVNLDATSTILPTAGSPAASSRAADILDVSSAPAAGTITVTGGTPTLTMDVVLSVPSGTVTATGAAPTIGTGFTIPSGTVTATGQIPTLAPGLFSRASTATYFDAALILQIADVDQLRDVAYNQNTGVVYPTPTIEPASTNWNRNPRGEGTTSSFGTVPNNWAVTNTGGGNPFSVVGNGIEDGIPYADVRYLNAASNGNYGLQTETTTGIPIINGQLWAVSAYVRLVAGTIPGWTQFGLGMYGYNSSGTFVAAFGPNMTSTNIFPTAAPLRTQRYTSIAEINNATVVYGGGVRLGLVFPAGSYDFTLRIGCPQTENVTATNNFAFPLMAWSPAGLTPSFWQNDSNGRARAITLTDTAVLGAHNAFFTTVGTLQLNQLITLSVYVQDVSRRYIGMYLLDQGTQANQCSVHFDLQTGTIVSGPAVNGAASGVSASIIRENTATSTGWYRISVGCILSAATTPSMVICRIYLENTPGSTANYTGVGSAINLAHPQLLQGPLDSYISNSATSPMFPLAGSPGISSRAADQLVSIQTPAAGVVTATGSTPDAAIVSSPAAGIVTVTGGQPTLTITGIVSSRVTLPPIVPSAALAQFDLASSIATFAVVRSAATAQQFTTGSGLATFAGLTSVGISVQQDMASSTSAILPLSATAIVQQFTTASATLSVASLTASGQVGQQILASSTSGFLGASAAGSAQLFDLASARITIGGLSAAGTMSQYTNAAGLAAFFPISCLGFGGMGNPWFGRSSFFGLTAVSTAYTPLAAAGVTTIPPLTPVVIFGQRVLTSATVVLPPIVPVVAAQLRDLASATSSVPALQSVSTAVLRRAATGLVTLPGLTASGTALFSTPVAAAVSLPGLTCAVSARQAVFATGIATIPLSARGTALFTTPAVGRVSIDIAVQAFGTASQIEAAGRVTLVEFTVRGISIALPTVTPGLARQVYYETEDRTVYWSAKSTQPSYDVPPKRKVG